MENHKFFASRISIYYFVIVICEIYQYYLINESGYIYGDFFSNLQNRDLLELSLGLAILTWLFSCFIIIYFSAKNVEKFTLPVNKFIVIIYIMNLLITVYTKQGVIGAEVNASYLSIILTLIPIGYLITLNFIGNSGRMKLLIVSCIYIAIDLYRSFLGAILHVFYLLFITIKNKKILIVPVILLLLASQPLIRYKNELRSGNSQSDEILVFNLITSRISTISTFQYGFENSVGLSEECTRDEYANILVTSITALIPKKVLGIDSSKTFNNCLIEYHLNRVVDDSSVNSPWLLNLYLLYIKSPTLMLFYLIVSLSLIGSLTYITNNLLGSNSIVFLSTSIPAFISTGNVLFIVIPIYFITVLFVLKKMKV